MRQSISLLALTLTAPSAVAAYRAVGFDGAQATIQGQKVQGVARYAAATGEAYAVDVVGTAIVEAGAAFSKGDSLIVDGQGRAIAATGALAVKAGATAVTSTAANGAVLGGADLPEYVFADALEVAAASGRLVEVLLRR